MWVTAEDIKSEYLYDWQKYLRNLWLIMNWSIK